jgi:hypothetical protein
VTAVGKNGEVVYYNTQEESMNTYEAFYNRRKMLVQAETVLEAQTKAAQVFRAKHRWQVNIFLVEKNGEAIYHSAQGYIASGRGYLSTS